MTLANAGHLPPYLNGEPMAMEGALPLGMIDGAEFSVTRFLLPRLKASLVKSADLWQFCVMGPGIAEPV